MFPFHFDKCTLEDIVRECLAASLHTVNFWCLLPWDCFRVTWVVVICVSKVDTSDLMVLLLVMHTYFYMVGLWMSKVSKEIAWALC